LDRLPRNKDGDSADEFHYLDDGEFCVYGQKYAVRVLTEVTFNNYFLLTERFNHYCLMCSKRPKTSTTLDCRGVLAAIPLIDHQLKKWFTGGDRLFWRGFFAILEQ